MQPTKLRSLFYRQLLSVLSALGVWGGTHSSAAPPSADEVFRNLILQRVQAHSRGDLEGYRALLTDDFVHVDDVGKRRTVGELASLVGKGNHDKWEVAELHARRISESLAIVDCEVTEVVPFGPREVRMPLHETDVFVLRGDRWLFLEHAETHALESPKRATPDSKTLDDYIGLYEWWPGYVDTITRKRNQLFGQSTDDTSPTELHAASNEAFFIEGDPGLTVFVRGADGKVLYELIHFPDGKVIVARKLDSPTK
jgi:Domain of unknown function (DUF4440)